MSSEENSFSKVARDARQGRAVTWKNQFEFQRVLNFFLSNWLVLQAAYYNLTEKNIYHQRINNPLLHTAGFWLCSFTIRDQPLHWIEELQHVAISKSFEKMTLLCLWKEEAIWSFKNLIIIAHLSLVKFAIYVLLIASTGYYFMQNWYDMNIAF